MAGVTVSTAYPVSFPLAQIPRHEWEMAVRAKAKAIGRALNVSLPDALRMIDEMEQLRAWEALDLKRETFFAVSCRLDPAELPLIRKGFAAYRKQHGIEPLTQADALAALAGPEGVPQRMTHAEAGERGGRGKKATTDRRGFSTESAAGIVARLKRDRPDIAARLAAGEFRSARAAAREAGWVKPPDPLKELRRWWERASDADRAAFLREVARAPGNGEDHV